MKAIQPHTIFLVEDDPVFLGLIEKYLAKNASFIIKTFPVGELCIDNLDQNPEIIILDYFLNSKYEDASNGLKLLKEIKVKKPNINVIMLSGQEDIQVAVESLKNGAYEYIVKGPTAAIRLQHVIQKVISTNELSKENKEYKMRFILFAIFTGLLIGFIISLWLFKPSLF